MVWLSRAPQAKLRGLLIGHANLCVLVAQQYLRQLFVTNPRQLVGLEALCQNCHDVKHIFFARNNARWAELLRHFIAVNRISPQEAEAYLQAARQRQQRLNQKGWTINYGNYNCWMPALANKEQRRDYAGFLRPSRQPHPQPTPSADPIAAEPMTD